MGPGIKQHSWGYALLDGFLPWWATRGTSKDTFSLPLHVFQLPWYRNDNLAEYIILVSKLFFLKTLKTLFHCFLALKTCKWKMWSQPDFHPCKETCFLWILVEVFLYPFKLKISPGYVRVLLSLNFNDTLLTFSICRSGSFFNSVDFSTISSLIIVSASFDLSCFRYSYYAKIVPPGQAL